VRVRLGDEGAAHLQALMRAARAKLSQLSTTDDLYLPHPDKEDVRITIPKVEVEACFQRAMGEVFNGFKGWLQERGDDHPQFILALGGALRQQQFYSKMKTLAGRMHLVNLDTDSASEYVNIPASSR
jgi:hypothetical protein